jgi:hypothetical protein
LKAIYADTYVELTVKMIGYYHDHCWHHYSGRTENVPENLKKFVTENYKFVFIYEEAEPKQHETKVSNSEN